jgi:hypothetical protein
MTKSTWQELQDAIVVRIACTNVWQQLQTMPWPPSLFCECSIPNGPYDSQTAGKCRVNQHRTGSSSMLKQP